jgi:hypothetical protein
MAQVEAIVQPDSIGNDLWRKSMALVGILVAILTNSETSLVSTFRREVMAFVSVHRPILSISGSLLANTIFIARF